MTIPTLISNLNIVEEIVVGWEHVFARVGTHEIFGWGATHYFELKDTTDSYWRSPRKVDFIPIVILNVAEMLLKIYIGNLL